MDKFALVYEFNTESPLITYKASKELEAKNYNKALELLSSAIEKYPYHSTTYFMYALALSHNGEYDKAKEFITKGDDLLGEKSTADFYYEFVDIIKREADGISINFDETVNEVLNESFIEPEEFSSTNELELNELSSSVNEKTNFDQNSIVTETLAEIYASQSNYDEALEIYHKLKIVKPELMEKFNNRIAELEIALENKKQKRFGN